MDNYSPLNWNKYFAKQIFINKEIPIYINAAKSGPNIICIHGAGHSGLSFACLAKECTNYRIISFDIRGHGYNLLSPKTDLSMQTMISDTESILLKINELYPEDNMIIIGHSFGGAIAIKSCNNILKTEQYPDLYNKIQALLVIDVVEGSALDSLSIMKQIVSTQLHSFSSIEEGIKYMHKSQIRNIESVRVSVPPLLQLEKKVYEWKTDLLQTEKYWTEWYSDMSNNFLSIKVPKALILTDTSVLDTPLTIAHMQGKFKLIVMKGVGHFIHEDDPKAFYEVIKDFINVFKIVGKVKDVKMINSKLGDQTKITKYVEFKG